MKVIEDPQRLFTLEDLLNPEWVETRLTSNTHKTVKGMTASAWWVIVEVENSSDTLIDWVLEAVHPHTDYLDLYHIDAQGEIAAVHTGDKRPFNQRQIASETFAFPLATPAHAKEQFVLRYAYHDIGMVELSMRIWDPASYQANREIGNYLYGGLFGAGLFVILFTFIIHIPTRLPVFYWYLAYWSFALAGSVANTGLGHRFIWHDSSYLTDSAHILFLACAFGFAIQFNRVFLHTKLLMPRADRLLQLLLGMTIAGGLCDLIGYRGLAGNILMLTSVSLAIMPLIGLWAWKVLERTDARWYVIAWSAWSIAMIINIGHFSGIIEMGDTALWFSRMVMLLEAVILGLALIDQINVLRNDKLAAEEREIDSLENLNLILEEKVQLRTIELEQARQAAESRAETDTLTGIGNRRFFFSRGENALQLAKRHDQLLTLIMFDIDNFKRVNDTWGHAVGDLVIKRVAELSRQRLRTTDILGRIGGEEFAFILIATGLAEARIIAENLRAKFASVCIDTPSGDIHFTVSFGVTSLLPQDESIDTVLQRADEALYCAKDNGRNCVEISPVA
jgi:diguanylate cyclase (GGDEF)-like protein